MNLLLVGIGGTLGSLFRYELGKLMSQKTNTAFPIGTFAINLAGALALGALTSMNAANHVYFLLGDGFLGSFTTFSTFMYEGFRLFQGREKLNAFTYIISSLMSGGGIHEGGRAMQDPQNLRKRGLQVQRA